MFGELAVLTPEKTVVTFRMAGLGRRVTAHLIDVAVVLLGFIPIRIILGIATLFLGPGIGDAIFLVLTVFWPLGYFIAQEQMWSGQTVGKKVMGLRVRMSDGTPITAIAAIGRNLLRPADLLPGIYAVGLVAILCNAKSQRLGDLVADTVVCLDDRPTLIFAPAPHEAGIHPMESRVGDLRGMTDQEYDVLRRLADRFPELTPDTQRKLVAEVWEPFAARRGVPEVSDVHPIYLIEAVVMKAGRERKVG